MDGNGRWAERRGLPVADGHREGTRALRRTVEAAIDLGVRSLAVYAFSTENWTRPADEVESLMEIFGETIERELPDLAKQGVRTRFIGRRDRAPVWLQERMAALEAETASNDRLSLWIAFDYGGRAELVEATRRLIEAGVRPEDVDENALAAQLYAPELPDPDLLIRTSRRASALELPPLAARLCRARLRRDALAGLRRGRPSRRARRLRDPAAALRRTMSNFVSRVLITIVGVPVVLYLVYLGDWWLFGLAAFAALIALHEFYVMARSLRPLVLAGYAGALAALLGAELGGPEWMMGGFMLTLVLAFLLYGIAETRQTATVTMSSTVLGVAWIALGLGHLLLLRDFPEHGRLAVFTVLLAVFADDTAAYLVGRLLGRHKLAPSLSPGKTWEGFVAGTLAAIAVAFFALYEQDFLSIPESIALGAAVALAGAAGDLFESALKRDLQVKDSGQLLGGHGGMLDRIDSLLFASVAAFYVVIAWRRAHCAREADRAARRHRLHRPAGDRRH